MATRTGPSNIPEGKSLGSAPVIFSASVVVPPASAPVPAPAPAPASASASASVSPSPSPSAGQEVLTNAATTSAPRGRRRDSRRRGGYSSDRSAGSSASEGGRRRRGAGGGALSRTLPELPCHGQEAFMEDAAAALNTRLTALGATFQLPLLADRTPYGCAMLVSDILIILPTLASPGDTSVLLQSLALTLSWCSEPLNEETALAVLEATEGLAVHGDPETSHAACVALNALLKHCLPKKKQGVQAKVITMLPGNDGTVDGTLAEVYLNAVSVQTKTQAALAVTHLVELGSHLMQQAAPTSSRAFMSYSERLGSILHHLHHSCITALRHKDLQPSNAQHVASLLHLLQSAVALTPYYKLPATAALLSEFIPDLLVMAAGNEKGSVIAAMQVLCSAVGSKRPFQQMASALEAAPEALDQVCELARTRHFVAFKHEAVRLWSAVARNYSWIVLPRLEVLLQLIRDLQEAPDQMSKLTALLFISAASDQSLPSVMQPSEEIPVIDFACFGTSNLPPGADATEVTTTGDMLRKPSTVQEGASTHACVFADKQPLFLEVVHSLVLPLVSDPVAAVRGHAVLALGNIPPATLDSLPSEQSRLLFDTVLETCRDDNNTVRGAVAKVVGVWVGAACILERRGCVVNALLEMFRAEQQALHQKAAWALSCLCERLRGAGDVDDQEALSSIVRGCMEVLDRLPNKVPWNVVRALGNSGLLYAGPLDSVLRALSRLFDDSNVKVRWNTAYAIAQIFRNPHLRVVYQEASQSRSPSPQGALALVTKLATVLQNEQNFKVRIQACWALAALQAFPIQGKTLPLVLGAVLKALHSCDSHIDHEQYKYRDVLTVSLKGLILHVLRFCMKVAKGATGSTLSSEDKHEVVSCLVDLRPHIVEVLEGMLPPLDEDMRDEMTSISSPTPCTASFIDIDEVPIITSQNAASTSLFIHDPRWVQLKGSIEVILADVRATVAPPRVVPAELTSPVTAVDASHLEQTLHNFAAMFQSVPAIDEESSAG